MRKFILVLALIGIALSSITLWMHYFGNVPAATKQSTWNSSLVSHSSYAVVHGIPIALFGIVGYAIVAVLTWKRRRFLLVIASLFGLAYGLYLTNIEAHILNVWCVDCVGSLIVLVLITLMAFGQIIFTSPARSLH
jgi:vitamin-K-epoxide reductase (warfarin-sensitive)